MEYVEQRANGYYVKGSRVPLDLLVHEFLGGASLVTIRQDFPTLTLEQVFGAIAFYLAHQADVDASIRDAETAWAEVERTHPLPQGIQDRLREARERMIGRR